MPQNIISFKPINRLIKDEIDIISQHMDSILSEPARAYMYINRPHINGDRNRLIFENSLINAVNLFITMVKEDLDLASSHNRKSTIEDLRSFVAWINDENMGDRFALVIDFEDTIIQIMFVRIAPEQIAVGGIFESYDDIVSKLLKQLADAEVITHLGYR